MTHFDLAARATICLIFNISINWQQRKLLFLQMDSAFSSLLLLFDTLKKFIIGLFVKIKKIQGKY